MKKSSIYNTLLDLDGLFNAASDKIIVFTPELFDIYSKHKEQPDSLAAVHPELFGSLVENGMIVDEETDEPAAVIDRWKQQDNDRRYFQIIINPTLQCNLRCWYCYENHDAKTVMTDEVRESVIKLVDDKVCQAELEEILIGFFGGEPLMYFRECVQPILEHASTECEKNGKLMRINFTTNGVLITGKVIEVLKEITAYAVSFQITLDGNRFRHNDVRYTSSNNGTYDIIINNIKALLAVGFQVNIRCNYTEKITVVLAILLKIFMIFLMNIRVTYQ